MKKALFFIALSCCVLNTVAQEQPLRKSKLKDSTNEASPAKKYTEVVYVSKISYIGNKKTKEKIISREVDIDTKASYVKSDLLELIKLDENKIFNTGLFTSVKGEIIPSIEDPKQVTIIFFVEERWYIWPSIIFKLADRNFSDWLFNQNAAIDRFEYGFKFDQFNVRGLNEKLSVLAQFGFKQKFGLGYRIPYLNKAQTFGMGFGFYYSELDQIDYANNRDKRVFISADSLFPDRVERTIISTEISSRLDFTYRESYYNTHTFGVYFRRRFVLDTILSSAFNPNYITGDDNTQKSIDLFYSFRRDFRDRNNYPLKGFYINAFLLKRGLGIFGDINQFSTDLQVATYKPLYKDRIYLANSFTGHTSAPRRQPYTTFDGLGFGNNLLKGYELYVIQGQHYLMNKNELKLRLFTVEGDLGKFMFLKQFRKIPLSAYFKVFFDHGYVDNNIRSSIDSQLSNRYLYSTGVGLDLVTYYDAVLRFEYSINALGETGFYINVKSGI
ncbi:MAG: hypothetical protein ACJAT1_001659 [Marivirga sp.]|jgi:hypothetical protein